MQEIETNDTYEVAYYMLFGGIIKSVKTRNIPYGKREKMGFSTRWIIVLGNIPDTIVETWRSGKAKVNIWEYKSMRVKLKKKIHKLL